MPSGQTDAVSVLSRASLAAEPRTLVDVFDATVRAHPDAPALDDGNVVLSYAELRAEAGRVATSITEAGVTPGARIGVRIPSGSVELYAAILGVLVAGAAYVPVDVDDPDERARLVFDEADVDGTLTAGLRFEPRVSHRDARSLSLLSPAHDAWIIFTSGSTGTPKGVAVTHRSAAAFVDAEARLFLPTHPLSPGDRVLAGLSVAFDASCEEMWLAWRHGACLVPAPRALVRSGVDLGPWLVARRITAVSTVPTLASVWPPDSLGAIRLLIFGGEACPPELAARLAVDGREVWNTYGPTETTVVACGARLTGDGPVRIGLPLDGWDLAVVDRDLEPVDEGEVGELIIGGVGLARYLDPVKDAEKFAPMPTLGWRRAYRSGDLVRYEPEGLLFVGRADDQVKVGGRRIELGEIDAALQALPGVAGAAAAVRQTDAGHPTLIGYLLMQPGHELDRARSRRLLRTSLPAALIPRLTAVDTLPTQTSGKVDRAALPWPLRAPSADDEPAPQLEGIAAWVAEQWARVLGTSPATRDEDFFDLGGGSLAAAQVVTMLRERYPEVTVADVYEQPTLGALADRLAEFEPPVSQSRIVMPTSRRAQALQLVLSVPLFSVVALRWLTWIALANDVLHHRGMLTWAPQVSWWVVVPALLVLVSPVGRLALAALVVRLTLRGVRPGSYRRGGGVHLRVWFAEGMARSVGAEHLAGAPWVTAYARALGAKVGRDVDLHAMPPVTGLLTLGKGSSIEAEVDLCGYWVDGDLLHLGRIRVGAGAAVGSRSTLAPGTRIGQDAEIAPGSAVSGAVPPGELWAGSPATLMGAAPHAWPRPRPHRSRIWVGLYAVSALLLSLLPAASVTVALLLGGRGMLHATSAGEAARRAVPEIPVVALASFGLYAVLVIAFTRLLGLRLREGHHAVRSRIGWQVWATERLIDEARTFLFPLYASLLTPLWLRALGTRVGRGVEASTVLLLPKMTTIGDEAFVADDTLIGSYELGGGWLRIARVKVGKRAFLGNSSMTAPGRRLPKRGLVAVLSATPPKAKPGTSWLGSPPVELRRTARDTDGGRTYAPAARLRVARAVCELGRLLAPIVTFALGAAVVLVLEQLLVRHGLGPTALLGGPVVIVAALAAGLVATLAKWLLVGRIRASEHPLWSSFVWRNEVADTFVEMVAAPWLLMPTAGTPVLTLWLRSVGARIGRGVWCESHWLPEADLVRLGAGATVNRGCVVQTHLFHDRIMSLDRVTLAEGSTLGPHGVILPAASLGASTTVGPASLVMRGDTVPAASRWTGNPIAPWAPTRARQP